VRLYADFYSSDILVASPLSLRRLIGGGGGGDDEEEDKGGAAAAAGGRRRGGADADFLSSIELVIVDGAESMLMQVRAEQSRGGAGMPGQAPLDPSRPACLPAAYLVRTGITSATSSQPSTCSPSRFGARPSPPLPSSPLNVYPTRFLRQVRDTDFTRVREADLGGLARYARQTLVFSG